MDNIEKESYSKSSYRMVQRVRAQGAEYGIDVPYLQYPLPQERSTGLALKTMLALSAVLVAAGVGLLLWAIIRLFVPVISTIGDLDWADNMHQLPLLSLIGSLSTIMIWIVVIAVPLLALAMVIGGLNYLFTLLRISRLSMPEKAVGFYLGRVKKLALIYAITSSVVTIALFIIVPTVVVGIIGALIAVYLWALFAVLQNERNRALPKFKSLPAEQQADFTAHSQALKLAHSRRNARKATQIVNGSRNGKLGIILALLGDFDDARVVYNNLKDNDIMRPTATGLAKRALWQLLNFTLSVLGGLAIIWGLMAAFIDVILLKVIFIIPAVAVILYSLLVAVPVIINFAVKQLKLNHHYLGWVALGLTLLAVVAMVGLIFLILSTFGA